MSIIDYLKDRYVFFSINIVLATIIFILLYFLKVGSAIIFSVFIIWFLPLLSYIVIEANKSCKFYGELKSSIEKLDKKYLLAEIIKEPKFVEGRVLYNTLKEINKCMHEHVNEYENMQLEYREYMETWVHEIKTPISSIELIIENNQSEVTENILNEIKKIEGFVEQVLYYSRANNVSKDYIINKFDLKSMVQKVIRKNAKYFIRKKISIDINNVNGFAYTDIKWVEFIVNQIIINSLKYCEKDKGKIKIFTKENKNNTILIIEDNGVGIIEKDIKRVFDKGFTGYNGRMYEKSTGMGLYLCKILCNKLGIKIFITSKVNKGTKVFIVFPLSNLTMF